MLQALRGHHISAVELLSLHMERIERQNPRLNAIVTWNHDAGETARRADQQRSQGNEEPLLGLPVTLKDCIYARGMPTTGGIQERAHIIDAEDALLTARVRDSGAVIIGKTNVPPFASNVQTNNSLFGRSCNPWDLARTPGGSTGGGAAAVAAGLSPLEFGGDFYGSIRIPAAFCGIYGHKPSLSAVPGIGHFPGGLQFNPASAIAVLGPLARSARDLELALEVTAGSEPGESAAWHIAFPRARHERLVDFRVAILPWMPWLPVAEEIRGCLDQLREQLNRLGVAVSVMERETLGDYRTLYKTYLSVIAAIETTTTPIEDRNQRAQGYRDTDDEFLLAWADGMQGRAQEYIQWYEKRVAYRAAFTDFFRQWDVLLAPVNLVNAFPHSMEQIPDGNLQVDDQIVRYGLQTAYPALASFTGLPATAFPAGQTSSGLPIGLQAIGPYLEDRTCIRFADLLSEEIGGFMPPPGFPLQ